MSKRLVLTPYNAEKWQLEYKYTRKYKDLIIEAPKGFITDLASIPRFLWIFMPPFGKYTRAAVIHDYLCFYEKVIGDQALVDRIFLDMMIEDGVSPSMAKLMFYAVRAAYIIKYRRIH